MVKYHCSVRTLLGLLLPFNGRFARWTWVSQFHLRSFSSTYSAREPLVELVELWSISGTGYLTAQCPSCYPATSLKVLKETQSTNQYQWSGIILISSTTGLVTERPNLHPFKGIARVQNLGAYTASMERQPITKV